MLFSLLALLVELANGLQIETGGNTLTAGPLVEGWG
jgi:hypothetical protein